MPSRDDNPELPLGWQEVTAGDRHVYFNFAEITVNVVAEQQDGDNILPTLLREWFGPDAGLPGTNFEVECGKVGDGWVVNPLGRDEDTELVHGKRYSREQIPTFFGTSCLEVP